MVLDDDKSIFPPYNISFGVRDSAAEQLGPEGQQVVEAVQKYMTEDVLQELNARVDVDKEKPEAVAGDYLLLLRVHRRQLQLGELQGRRPAARRRPPAGWAQAPLEPKPPSPRMVAAELADLDDVGAVTGTTTSCAIRSPGATVKGASRSVFSSSTFSSPR